MRKRILVTGLHAHIAMRSILERPRRSFVLSRRRWQRTPTSPPPARRIGTERDHAHRCKGGGGPYPPSQPVECRLVSIRSGFLRIDRIDSSNVGYR